MKIFINCLIINYSLFRVLYKSSIFFTLMVLLVGIITFTIPLTLIFDYKIPNNIIIVLESLVIIFIISLPMHSRYVVYTVLTKDMMVHYPITDIKRIIYSTFSILSNPEVVACFFSSSLTIIIMNISGFQKILLIPLMYLIILNVIVWDKFIFETFKKWSEAVGFFFFITILGLSFSSKILYDISKEIINISKIKNISFGIVILALCCLTGIYIIYLVDKIRYPNSNYIS